MIVTIYSNDTQINWGATGNERIIENVRNILRTRMFEVPFERLMGIDPDYIDAATNKVTAGLSTHIIQVINAYEERVTVLDVTIDSVDADGNYVFAVKLEV